MVTNLQKGLRIAAKNISEHLLFAKWITARTSVIGAARSVRRHKQNKLVRCATAIWEQRFGRIKEKFHIKSLLWISSWYKNTTSRPSPDWRDSAQRNIKCCVCFRGTRILFYRSPSRRRLAAAAAAVVELRAYVLHVCDSGVEKTPASCWHFAFTTLHRAPFIHPPCQRTLCKSPTF